MPDAADWKRARAALSEDPWSAEQHRRVRRRLDDALSKPRWAFWTTRAFAFTAAALIVVVAGVGMFLRQAPVQPPVALSTVALVTPGSKLVGTPTAKMARLIDGSIIEVAPAGQLEVVADGAKTRVELTAGRAVFEVNERQGRPFLVSACGVDVSVVGTRFAVELDRARVPTVVRVSVSHGVVEVRNRGDAVPKRISAGQQVELSEAAVTPPAPPPSAAVSAPAPPQRALDAAQLFELGAAARKSGDVSAAVRAYQLLLKQYPADQRAGVVALELGRLEMDTRHDFAAAAAAFRRAVAAAPNAGIREDAQARLVGVLDAMHSSQACLLERQRYLAAFPHGVHGPSVQGKCGGR